jgi:ribonuclease PH
MGGIADDWRVRAGEIQGTAEAEPFDRKQFDGMLDLAETGIRSLFEFQAQALAGDGA